jgi:hypothetical protein
VRETQGREEEEAERGRSRGRRERRSPTEKSLVQGQPRNQDDRETLMRKGNDLNQSDRSIKTFFLDTVKPVSAPEIILSLEKARQGKKCLCIKMILSSLEFLDFFERLV